ncbi:UDP-glucuronosyltransferase 1A1-like [Rana temporaria]|uniref:UDP-glucuronosyltransferase 1A1-like n=1 Tax=Rana temporaria TaxID=8407 RepID=UPI001AACF4C3|nr:UDP-glucuronosyltransferase 1A1-like [Rana temporaria]
MAKMFHYVQVTAVLFFSFGYVTFVEPGNVLVVPVEGSHWLSMRAVVDMLGQKGHQIFVVAPDFNIHIQASEGYRIKLYPVSYSREDLQNHLKSFAAEVFTERPLLQKFMKIHEKMKHGAALMFDTCVRLLNNKELIRTLEETTFDVIFTDPVLPCGQILAEHLAVPSVYFLRSIFCHKDAISSQCPIPLSYVPRQLSGLADHMIFPQRLQNLFFEIVSHFLCDVLYSPYQQLASEFLQREVSLHEILGHAAIWLMRLDFAFDYTKPVMPNMVFIGGINCVQRKPLNQVRILSI